MHRFRAIGSQLGSEHSMTPEILLAIREKSYMLQSISELLDVIFFIVQVYLHYMVRRLKKNVRLVPYVVLTYLDHNLSDVYNRKYPTYVSDKIVLST